jgi:hypothetical protein
LRKISKSRTEEIKGNCKICVKRSFILVFAVIIKYYWERQINDWTGGACRMHGRIRNTHKIIVGTYEGGK